MVKPTGLIPLSRNQFSPLRQKLNQCPMPLSQPPDTRLGRPIGDRQRYLLIELISNGDMGDVFLATDALLGQQVALKILNERLAIGELRKRFEREVAVIAALRSDHIV